MPNGASPRETSASAARTFSARATCFSTLVQTPSFSSALLPYLPAGTLSGLAMASFSVPSAAARPKFGAILSVELLDAGAISTSVLRRRLNAGIRRQQMALVEIVHPVQVGGNENVRRRAGLDLLGQCVAGAIRNDHLVAGARLELLGLLVHRLLEACGREDGHVGGGGRGRGDRQIQSPARATIVRLEPAHAYPSSNVGSVIYRRIFPAHKYQEKCSGASGGCRPPLHSVMFAARVA